MHGWYLEKCPHGIHKCVVSLELHTMQGYLMFIFSPSATSFTSPSATSFSSTSSTSSSVTSSKYEKDFFHLQRCPFFDRCNFSLLTVTANGYETS